MCRRVAIPSSEGESTTFSHLLRLRQKKIPGLLQISTHVSTLVLQLQKGRKYENPFGKQIPEFPLMSFLLLNLTTIYFDEGRNSHQSLSLHQGAVEATNVPLNVFADD